MFGVPHCMQDSLLERVVREFCGFNFPYATMGLWSGETKTYCFFSDERWGKIYVDQQLFIVDPPLNIALKVPHQHICWKAINTGTQQSLDVMQMRYDICGLTAGMTYVFKKNNITTVVGLGGKGKEEHFLKQYIHSFGKIAKLTEDLMEKVSEEES